MGKGSEGSIREEQTPVYTAANNPGDGDGYFALSGSITALGMKVGWLVGKVLAITEAELAF